MFNFTFLTQLSELTSILTWFDNTRNQLVGRVG
jgi:hypothetical protein